MVRRGQRHSGNHAAFRAAGVEQRLPEIWTPKLSFDFR
jgi:hypothetical protein